MRKKDGRAVPARPEGRGKIARKRRRRAHDRCRWKMPQPFHLIRQAKLATFSSRRRLGCGPDTRRGTGAAGKTTTFPPHPPRCAQHFLLKEKASPNGTAAAEKAAPYGTAAARRRQRHTVLRPQGEGITERYCGRGENIAVRWHLPFVGVCCALFKPSPRGEGSAAQAATDEVSLDMQCMTVAAGGKRDISTSFTIVIGRAAQKRNHHGV